MRAVVWICVKLSRVFLFVGGVCVLALAAAFVLLLLGEKDFPAPLQDEPSGFGTYAWQVGVMLIGAFALWRVLAAIVWRLGAERDILASIGREDH